MKKIKWFTLFSNRICLLSLGTFKFKEDCIYCDFFLDYNDYLTNYSSSVPGNKDLLGVSTINSPYAWCINASDTEFNITLDQVSYITGISFQGDSNTGSFIRKFRIRYLQKGSWKTIHDVWYFSRIFAYGRKVSIDCLHDLFLRFCIKTWKSSENRLN